MRGALDHGQLVGAAHHGLRLAVELQHFVVEAAHDEQRRRPDGGEPGPGQIGAAAARDDGVDPGGWFRGGPERGPGTRAGSEIANSAGGRIPPRGAASPWPRTAGGPAVRCQRRWPGSVPPPASAGPAAVCRARPVGAPLRRTCSGGCGGCCRCHARTIRRPGRGPASAAGPGAARRATGSRLPRRSPRGPPRSAADGFRDAGCEFRRRLAAASSNFTTSSSSVGEKSR